MIIKNNQKGTGAVLLILLLVVVAVIGLIGWFVWNNKASKPASESSSTKTSTQKAKTTEPIKQTATYFEIKELGIKFETDSQLTGLYYTIGNNNRTAYFSLDDLKNTDCAADKTSQIALSRYTDADFEEDIQSQPQKATAKKIGSYYYIVTSGQAACADDNSTDQIKASQMQSNLIKILPMNLVNI